MTRKEIAESIRDFWDYLLWRDMGNLGEGCLASLFIWAIVLLIGGLITGVIFFDVSINLK